MVKKEQKNKKKETDSSIMVRDIKSIQCKINSIKH